MISDTNLGEAAESLFFMEWQRMDRNKLTEHLLGLEIDIRFISIKEARKAGVIGDSAELETALHHAIKLAIDGERDLTVLAEALRQALVDAGFRHGVDEILELFCEKNKG
jgi:hypothetical protein